LEKGSEISSSGKHLSVYRLESGNVSIKFNDETDRPYKLRGPNCLGEFIVVLPDAGNAYIISGSCTTKSPTKDFILNPGAIFGETTFINGPLVHPYDVITNEVTFIAVIDAYYLNVVFQHFPELAGKFYRWISKVLCARLIQLGFIR